MNPDSFPPISCEITGSVIFSHAASCSGRAPRMTDSVLRYYADWCRLFEPLTMGLRTTHGCPASAVHKHRLFGRSRNWGLIKHPILTWLDSQHHILPTKLTPAACPSKVVSDTRGGPNLVAAESTGLHNSRFKSMYVTSSPQTRAGVQLCGFQTLCQISILSGRMMPCIQKEANCCLTTKCLSPHILNGEYSSV